jgi:hypothetical protein
VKRDFGAVTSNYCAPSAGHEDPVRVRIFISPGAPTRKSLKALAASFIGQNETANSYAKSKHGLKIVIPKVMSVLAEGAGSAKGAPFVLD